MAINYSPEQIQEMKDSGKPLTLTVTDTGKATPEVTRTSVVDADVSVGASWGSSPRITSPGAGTHKVTGPAIINDAQGNPVQQHKITAPNIDRFNQQSAERKLAELEARDKEREALSKLDPEQLNATLQALTRKVARLEKQLKEVSK